MALPSNTKRKIFDGRYEIISIVGRGADSVVYHARHISGSAQEVALKVLVNRKGRSSLSDRLRKEALTLVSCRHKYVIRLDDFHSIGELCYLSMEFAPLGDLAQYTTTQLSKIPVNQAQTFLEQALEALDFIHATGVIHRDLKPENILVVSDKEIRLADFGLALLPGDTLNAEDLQTGVGTLDYLAPEVLEGIRYDTRSDLYSLGVLFYELLAGKHPFNDAPLAEQLDVRRDNRVFSLEKLAPEVPAHFAAVVSTLMRFDASKRFASASEALNALQNEQFRVAEEPPPSELTKQPALHHETAVANARSVSSAETVATSMVTSIPASSDNNAVSPFTEPANSDTSSDRAAQPTEKIDLERIKAIIAKDTHQRATAVQDELLLEPDPSELFDVRPKSLAQRGKHPINLPIERSAISSKLLMEEAIQVLGRLPLPARLVSVAAISALFTIAALFILPMIIPASSVKNAPMEASESLSSTVADGSTPSEIPETTQKVTPFVSSLIEGIYSGTLQGLIPNSDTPVLLVSIPQSHKLVLILGIEGWIPAEASTLAEDGSLIESPTFRSNGVLLRFNGELSSGEIIGKFTNILSGESGFWNVKRTS